MRERAGFFCSFFSAIMSKMVAQTVLPVYSAAKQIGFSCDSGFFSIIQLLYCMIFLADKDRIS